MLWMVLLACADPFGSDTAFDFFDTGARCFDTGSGPVLYADVDEDGYGDPDAFLTYCDAPEGFIERAGDCNDARADVNPAAEETCGDGLDQDCDGVDPGC